MQNLRVKIIKGHFAYKGTFRSLTSFAHCINHLKLLQAITVAMIEQLTSITTPQRANEVVHQLLQEKVTLKDACAQVAEATERSADAIKKFYQRHSKDKIKAHGNNKLTMEEENILVCVIMVFSSFHEGLSRSELVTIANDFFDTNVGKQWYKSSMKQCKVLVAAQILKAYR